MKVYRVESRVRRIGPFAGANYLNSFGNRFMTEHLPRYDRGFEESCKDARYGMKTKHALRKLLVCCDAWLEKGNKKDKAKINNFVVREYNANKFLVFHDKQVMFERKNATITKEWTIAEFIKEGEKLTL